MKLQDALNHSKHVKFAKVLLLSLFCTLSAIIFVLPFIGTKNHDNLKIIASDNKEEVPETTDNSQNIVKPKFYGFDNVNRPYTITADKGTQVDKNRVELSNVFSDIKLDEGKNYIAMTSQTADVQLSEKILNLKGDIEITVDSEYKVNTDSAIVNYGERRVNGNEVKVEGKIGTINANSFSIDESYKVISFSDKVHTTLNSK